MPGDPTGRLGGGDKSESGVDVERIDRAIAGSDVEARSLRAGAAAPGMRAHHHAGARFDRFFFQPQCQRFRDGRQLDLEARLFAARALRLECRRDVRIRPRESGDGSFDDDFLRHVVVRPTVVSEDGSGRERAQPAMNVVVETKWFSFGLRVRADNLVAS